MQNNPSWYEEGFKHRFPQNSERKSVTRRKSNNEHKIDRLSIPE